MKKIFLSFFLISSIFLSLSAKVTTPLPAREGQGGGSAVSGSAVSDVSWQEKIDTIWPARHYRELDGEAIGSQKTDAWIDWKHEEGTVLVYGLHFPKGHVRADAVFKAAFCVLVFFISTIFLSLEKCLA